MIDRQRSKATDTLNLHFQQGLASVSSGTDKLWAITHLRSLNCSD